MEETSVRLETHLSDLEVRILDFERQWWKYAGVKDSAIRELFNLSAKQYYELLNNLIDRPDALAASPLLIKRLRRLREARVSSLRSRAASDRPHSEISSPFGEAKSQNCSFASRVLDFGRARKESSDLRTGIVAPRLGVSTRRARVISRPNHL